MVYSFRPLEAQHLQLYLMTWVGQPANSGILDTILTLIIFPQLDHWPGEREGRLVYFSGTTRSIRKPSPGLWRAIDEPRLAPGSPVPQTNYPCLLASVRSTAKSQSDRSWMLTHPYRSQLVRPFSASLSLETED